MAAKGLRKLVDLDFPLQLLERALDEKGILFEMHEHDSFGTAARDTFVRYHVQNRDITRARIITMDVLRAVARPEDVAVAEIAQAERAS